MIIIIMIISKPCAPSPGVCSLVADEGTLLLSQAVESFHDGSVVAASALFSAAAPLLYRSPAPFEGLGASLFQRGHFAAAAEAFLSSFLRDPGNEASFANVRTARDWDLANRLFASDAGVSTRGSPLALLPSATAVPAASSVSLVSSFFRGRYSERRFNEIQEAQRANLANPDVKALVLVADLDGDCDPRDHLPPQHHGKLRVVQQERGSVRSIGTSATTATTGVGLGAPSWGELLRVASALFPAGEAVVVAHGDIAFFRENATLREVPRLLCANNAPTCASTAGAGGRGNNAAVTGAARPVGIALTRRPHRRCLWASGGGHGPFDVPVDLCTGPHGAAEGAIGYDAFAFLVPPPSAVLRAAEALRTNRLGSDLRLVEAMAAANMLVIDPCVFVTGTQVHCTSERSYKFDDDIAERSDIEGGRYSRAVRIAGPHILRTHASNDASSDKAPPAVVLSFPHSGEDFLRRALSDAGVSSGSVEWDAERAAGDGGNAKNDAQRRSKSREMKSSSSSEGGCEDVSVVFVETATHGALTARPLLPGRSSDRIDGTRRQRSDGCVGMLLRSPPRSVKVLLVRDAFETIASSYLYKVLSHRSAHAQTRHRTGEDISNFIDSTSSEWRAFALESALRWSDFYGPFTADGGNRHGGVLIVTLSSLLRTDDLGASESHVVNEGRLAEVMRALIPGTHHSKVSRATSTYGLLLADGSGGSTQTPGFIDETFRGDVFAIVGAISCALELAVPIGLSCASIYNNRDGDDKKRHAAGVDEASSPQQEPVDVIMGGECFPEDSDLLSRCIAAYSLYGNDEKYVGGAISNAREFFIGRHQARNGSNQQAASLAPHTYFRMRVYHDGSVPPDVLAVLTALSVELIDVSASSLFTSMGQLNNPRAWRFAAASDPTVARYLVRDVDSRIGSREAAAIEAWVRKGKPFHVMRDHPSHAIYAAAGYTMQAGMWGGTASAAPEMTELMANTSDSSDDYYADQNFLAKKVWPLARERGVEQHDSFSCGLFPGAIPFPVAERLTEGDFVGAVVECDGKTRADDNAALSAAPPPSEECTDQK